MADDADPPRKVYTLKPREFERVNEPRNASPADGAPTDVQGHLQAANQHGMLYAKHRAPERTEVHALLAENIARENAAGLNDVAPVRKKRSRRTRDYWLVMIPMNAFFAWVAFGPGASAVTFVYGLGGMALFTTGFTWVMWFVMDDY